MLTVHYCQRRSTSMGCVETAREGSNTLHVEILSHKLENKVWSVGDSMRELYFRLLFVVDKPRLDPVAGA